MVVPAGPPLTQAHRTTAPVVIAAVTGTSFASRAALVHALHADASATLHRAILDWLGLSSRMRPAALRRLPRQGRASRRATRALMDVLATVARAYLLFQDMDAVRRWLARSTATTNPSGPTYPLAELESPLGRRRLASAMRRTAHGLF